MALAIAVVLVGASARGHVVYGTTTLRLLTLQSDLVVRARIVDPAFVLSLTDPPLRETVVVAEVLESLKGRVAEPELRFVQHGHGVVSYEAGDEVLVFLEGIAKSPELRTSRVAEHVHWLSRQESGAKFALEEHSRQALVDAARAYAALDALAPPERPAALRQLTVRMLASPNATLASSALRDVVLAGDAPLFSAAELPSLVAVLDDPDTGVGVRVGLLAELERRGLLEGPQRWAALLRTTSGSDRIAVVRAAAAHPSAPVAAELVKLIAAGDTQLVAAAAVSLGMPGYDGAVAPLAALLARDDSRVRMAAIRGLGRVGTPAATKALKEAAASHSDPATRRRAAAEVAVLAAGAR